MRKNTTNTEPQKPRNIRVSIRKEGNLIIQGKAKDKRMDYEFTMHVPFAEHQRLKAALGLSECSPVERIINALEQSVIEVCPFDKLKGFLKGSNIAFDCFVWY